MDNKKILFALSVLLLIIIIASFITARMGVMTGPPVPQKAEEKDEEITDEGIMPMQFDMETATPSSKPRAIKVIKKLPRQKEAHPGITTAEQEQSRWQQETLYSGSSPASTATGGRAGDSGDDYAEEPLTAGISKPIKPPTPAEREEYESKGVVLY